MFEVIEVIKVIIKLMKKFEGIKKCRLSLINVIIRSDGEERRMEGRGSGYYTEGKGSI